MISSRLFLVVYLIVAALESALSFTVAPTSIRPRNAVPSSPSPSARFELQNEEESANLGKRRMMVQRVARMQKKSKRFLRVLATAIALWRGPTIEPSHAALLRKATTPKETPIKAATRKPKKQRSTARGSDLKKQPRKRGNAALQSDRKKQPRKQRIAARKSDLQQPPSPSISQRKGLVITGSGSVLAFAGWQSTRLGRRRSSGETNDDNRRTDDPIDEFDIDLPAFEEYMARQRRSNNTIDNASSSSDEANADQNVELPAFKEYLARRTRSNETNVAIDTGLPPIGNTGQQNPIADEEDVPGEGQDSLTEQPQLTEDLGAEMFLDIDSTQKEGKPETLVESPLEGVDDTIHFDETNLAARDKERADLTDATPSVETEESAASVATTPIMDPVVDLAIDIEVAQAKVEAESPVENRLPGADHTVPLDDSKNDVRDEGSSDVEDSQIASKTPWQRGESVESVETELVGDLVENLAIDSEPEKEEVEPKSLVANLEGVDDTVPSDGRKMAEKDEGDAKLASHMEPPNEEVELEIPVESPIEGVDAFSDVTDEGGAETKDARIASKGALQGGESIASAETPLAKDVVTELVIGRELACEKTESESVDDEVSLEEIKMAQGETEDLDLGDAGVVSKIPLQGGESETETTLVEEESGHAEMLESPAESLPTEEDAVPFDEAETPDRDQEGVVGSQEGDADPSIEAKLGQGGQGDADLFEQLYDTKVSNLMGSDGAVKEQINADMGPGSVDPSVVAENEPRDDLDTGRESLLEESSNTSSLPYSDANGEQKQPKSRDEKVNLSEKYGSIENLEDRAFQILLDLGMIEVTGFSDSPIDDSNEDSKR